MEKYTEDDKHENAVATTDQSNGNTLDSSNNGRMLKRKRSDRPELQTPSQSLSREDCESLLPPLLPSQQGKYTLVIDMDGTILTEVAENSPYIHIDFAVEQISTGKRTFISKRPGLEKFLHQAAKQFEIVVFTESYKQRADVLLDSLENRGCIAHRLYRDSCTEIDGKLAKDLSRLGRDLSKVIIVDDCPFSYVLQRSNAIAVRWYNGNPRDRELRKVSQILRVLVSKKKAVHFTLNPALNPITTMTYLLPPSIDPLRPTLVLDMDKTLLIESSVKLPEKEGSDYFEVLEDYPDGRRNHLYVYKRPGLDLFLTEMAKVFEIVVFTLSIKARADYFLDQIDCRDNRISFRLYRDASYSGIKGKWIKDMSRLGRDLSRVILIDDTPISYEFQQTNAIPITPFQGLKSDEQLAELIPFLRKLAREEDVRPLIYDKFVDLEIRRSIDHGERDDGEIL